MTWVHWCLLAFLCAVAMVILLRRNLARWLDEAQQKRTAASRGDWPELDRLRSK